MICICEKLSYTDIVDTLLIKNNVPYEKNQTKLSEYEKSSILVEYYSGDH